MSPVHTPKIRRGDKKSLCRNAFVLFAREIIFALGLRLAASAFHWKGANKILAQVAVDWTFRACPLRP